MVKPVTMQALEPPGPPGGLPGKLVLELRRDPVSTFTRLARTYGDVVRFRAGGREIYLVSRPDLIRDILVTRNDAFVKGEGLRNAKALLGEGLLTSEGEFHQRQRRLIQPAFHNQRISEYSKAMVEYSLRTSERWHDGETLDMHREMMHLTLAIVAKVLFSADVEAEADRIGAALAASLEYLNHLMSPLAAITDRLPLPGNRAFREARDVLDATIQRMIDERRTAATHADDLLTMLLHAQDPEGTGGGMSDVQVRDEALTLFLAGHETTANALTWTWYLLSENPQAERKLHAELEGVLAGRPPTQDDIPALRYTNAVLTEAMRLYPPAWILSRECVEEYRIDGYVAPPGTTFLASQWIVHRDPRFYHRPDTFDPDRWTPEFRAALPRFAYFPFGGGPRVCIGEPFAWMEGTLALATLAQRWRARHVSDHPVALRPRLTLRPRYGMQMTLERRGPSPAP